MLADSSAVTKAISLSAARSLRLELWPMAALSVGLYTMAGFLVPILAARNGASASEIGAAVAAGSLLPLLLAVAAGRACDRFGTRTVLIVMALIAMVLTAATPLATSVPSLLGIQFAAGFARSMCWMAAQAHAITTGGPQASSRSVAFSFAAMFGTFLSPLAAGALDQALGIDAALCVAGLLYALLVLVALPLRTAAREGRDYRSGLRVALAAAAAMAREPGIASAMAATFLRFGSGTIRLAFFPLYLTGIGLTPWMVGVLTGVGNLAAVACVPLAAPMLRRFRAGHVLHLSLVLCLGAIAATPLVSSVISGVVLSVLWGVGMGLSLPALLQQIADSSGPGRQGMATGLREMINQAAALVSPLLLGIAISGLGLAAGFWIVGGTLCAVALVLSLSARPFQDRVRVDQAASAE